MNISQNRKQWSEDISVGIAVNICAFLFFETLRGQLPNYLQRAIEKSFEATAWAVTAAFGLSLLCAGIGVISVSGIRLLLALRAADASFVQLAAKRHLISVLMVVFGFWLSVAAIYAVTQIKP
jgi:hypothetical protein